MNFKRKSSKLSPHSDSSSNPLHFKSRLKLSKKTAAEAAVLISIDSVKKQFIGLLQ
jgi:hypothetical protein